jgi:DNA-binding NarL/FixJ family response regulator
VPDHDGVPPIRAVVGDDDARVREAVRDLLAGDDRFEVVGEAPDGEALLELAVRTGADLVVTDLRMPSGGVGNVQRLVALGGPVVVVLSAHSRPSVVEELLAAGAACFLDKGRLDGSLCDVLAEHARP